jgi:hypothetical protein
MAKSWEEFRRSGREICSLMWSMAIFQCRRKNLFARTRRNPANTALQENPRQKGRKATPPRLVAQLSSEAYDFPAGGAKLLTSMGHPETAKPGYFGKKCKIWQTRTKDTS